MDEEFFKDMVIDIYKINEKSIETFLNVSFNVVKEIPLDTTIIISIFQLKSNGKYATYFGPIQQNICDYISTDKIFYPSILQKSNFCEKCPFVAGKYELHNYQVPADIFPPIFKKIHGKITVELKKKSGRDSLIAFYGRIESQQ